MEFVLENAIIGAVGGCVFGGTLVALMEQVADVDVNFGLMHGLGIEAHPVVPHQWMVQYWVRFSMFHSESDIDLTNNPLIYGPQTATIYRRGINQ